MRRPLRLAFTLAVAGGLFFLTGARCVEHDALRRGPDGNWHLYGELFNETDVQGAEMVVQGTIFDADGNVLATATKPTCPRELSPGKPVVYDIVFPNTQDVSQPASHQVNVASGSALEELLPALVINPALNVESRPGGKIVVEAGLFRNQAHSGFYSFCMAFYDGAGDVVALHTVSTTGSTLDEEIPRSKISGAASMRIWIFASEDNGESPFQTFVSSPIKLPLELGATPQGPPIGF